MALNVTFDRENIPHPTAEALDQIIATLQTAFNQQADRSAATADDLAAQTSALSAGLVPTGVVTPYAGSVAPSGWLFCDGATYGTSAQSALFAVIGFTYGGSGSVFKVPDLRQRFPLGKAASGTGATLGGTGGAIDHTHSTPNHTHTISGETANESSHTHSFSDTSTTADAGTLEPVASGSDVSVPNQFHTHDVSGTTGQGSAHKHAKGTLAVDSGGSGTSGSGNPPYIALNYIIKA